MKTNKIVLHIPHSSINGIFDKEIGKWPRNAFFVNTCVKEHTDWFTDMLFHTGDNAIKEIIFPYSRFVCDVERLEDDELNRIGQGIVYTEYNGYKRGALSEEEYDKIVQLREEYLMRLKSHITENSILIDCHSFSNRTMEDTPDICIGEFYQFNLSSCIRQQNSLTAQFVSFSLSNLANIFYPPQFLQ